MGDQQNLEFSREVRDIWNQNAAFWDEYMGEGNDFQLVLIGPATERLLNLQQDEFVLDIACGNGNFARRMANLGARVVACDFSEVFVDRARARSADYAGRIEYRVIDATDREQLLALGQRHFDAAVCNMALMDMATIDPLLQTLPQLLKRDGRFVFSIAHPCFNTCGPGMVAEEEDRGGELITHYALKVSAYISPTMRKVLGLVGQPAPHYYFHRPLSLLLNTCFRAGFAAEANVRAARLKIADVRARRYLEPFVAARRPHFYVILFRGDEAQVARAHLHDAVRDAETTADVFGAGEDAI